MSDRRTLIVAGHGDVGAEVVREARRLGVEVTVIERQADRVADLVRRGDPGVRIILRDALDREALFEAGIDRADAFVTTLAALRDNLFLCVLARHASPELRIVSRADDIADARKFRGVVGATVVNPARIGGIRLTRLMILPELADFTDAMRSSAGHTELIRAIPIVKRAPLAGRRLGEAHLQSRTGCVVLGLRVGKGSSFRYHPSHRQRLKPGGAVLALGRRERLAELAELLSTPTDASASGTPRGAPVP
ncbi:MAG: hypothetical protein CSA66_01355 [Proteobacteria bacterium]|nr:MAG: hypothetical protein CSA66_01355 [Pseudomonadota bacterium]